MNKKILIIILIGVLAAGGFISFLVWKHYSKPNLPLKHYCQTDSDCVLSGSDPEGFGICVNKEWYEEWKKSPESKKYKWTCEYTGKERCACVNNKCQRIDSERGCGVKETQVIITTNKTEYERGEEVKITLNTNGNTLYFEHYNNRVSYYRLVDGNWELIPAGDWAGCHKVSCRDGVIESICREVHSPYCKKVNNILEKIWDQKMKVKKRVRCGKDIVELHTYQNVPPGTYKVKIDYFKDSKCQGKVYSVYSNEFIIKEKEISYKTRQAYALGLTLEEFEVLDSSIHQYLYAQYPFLRKTQFEVRYEKVNTEIENFPQGTLVIDAYTTFRTPPVVVRAAFYEGQAYIISHWVEEGLE